MADVTAEVKGLDELRRKLRELGPELAAKVLEKALKAGGAIVENAMRIEAGKHVKTGELVADLHTEVAIAPDGLAGRARIGFGREGHKARWVEFGHRNVSHGLLRSERKEIGHTPAHPFMRPAFDESQAEAKSTMANLLKDGVKDLP